MGFHKTSHSARVSQRRSLSQRERAFTWPSIEFSSLQPSLKSVAFGQLSKLEVIGVRAFCDTSIDEVHIPGSVFEMCDGCFAFCRDLDLVEFVGSVSALISDTTFFGTLIEQYNESFWYAD